MVEASAGKAGPIGEDVAEGIELGEGVAGVGGDPEVACGVNGWEVGAGHVVGEEGKGEGPIVGGDGQGGLIDGGAPNEGEERGGVGGRVASDVEDGSGRVGGGEAVAVAGVAKEGRAGIGGSGRVDAGNDEIRKGVNFGLRDDSVALEVLREGLAGGDIDEVVDGGEGIGQALLGCLGGGGADVGDVAHKAGKGVYAGDGGDFVDVDKWRDLADIAVGGAGAEDEDQ